MKIRSIKKRAGIFDLFKKKPQDQNVAQEVLENPNVIYEEDQQPIEQELSEMPYFKENEVFLKGVSPEEYAKMFTGKDNWSKALESRFKAALKAMNDANENTEKQLDQEDLGKFESLLDSIITKIIVRVCEATNLNYIPRSQISFDLLDSIKNSLGKNIIPASFVDLETSSIKGSPMAEEKAIALATKEIVISLRENGIEQYLQNLLLKQKEQWENEKRERDELLNEWQRSQQQLLKTQREEWARARRAKPSKFIMIENVEDSLMKRKREFNEIIDSALDSYRRGKRSMDRNPNMDPEMAYRDLISILEGRFRTEVRFGN